MDENSNVGKKTHKISMVNRTTCGISGVNDVLAFDNHEILLETEQGILMMKGNELHVGRLSLDKGEIDVEGKIDSLTYSEQLGCDTKSESLLMRLFK